MPESPPTVLDVRAGWDVPLAGLLPGAVLRDDPPVQLIRAEADTADARLAARGVSLHHVVAGRAGTGHGAPELAWTLEVDGAGVLGTWTGARDTVPAGAVRLVRGLTGGRPLGTVSVTVTTRRCHRLEGPDGALLAEVVDEVVDGPGGRRRSLRVLPGASRAQARALAKALRRAGAGAPSAPPTEGSGRRAGSGRPQRAKRNAPVGIYAASVVADGLDRILAEDPLLRLDVGADSVHRARVATRRLRSDLKTLRPVLEPVWAEQVRAALRWLGEQLGTVRDTDVLMERLTRRAAAAGPLPGTAGLLDAAGRQRDEAAGALLVALDSPRYLELLDLLERGSVHPHVRVGPDAVPPEPAALPERARRVPRRVTVEPDDEVRRALPTLVATPWRRLRRQVRALGPEPADEDLHQVRIRTKELRYAAEAAAPLLGRGVAAVADAAKALQTVLGDHHDAVVAEQWLRAAAGAADVEVAFAAGVLVGAERADQHRLRAEWQQEWKALRRLRGRSAWAT